MRPFMCLPGSYGMESSMGSVSSVPPLWQALLNKATDSASVTLTKFDVSREGVLDSFAARYPVRL